jgi:uncharacterized protein (TIGR02452 family)
MTFKDKIAAGNMASKNLQGFVMDRHLGVNSGRALRAEVAQETLKMVESRKNEDVSLKRIDMWDSSASDPLDCIPSILQPYPYTEIHVEVSDALDSAARLVNASDSLPLVLNMANPVVAGGGFLSGAGAQEEELCRRTNLYPVLQRVQYPLPEFGVLWSSPVDIIRHGPDRDYLPTSSTFQIAVASAAAYQQPPVDSKMQKLQEPVRSKMRRKIHSLLAAAAMQGHATLVLSAWGCGAFGNPSSDVAELFREALHDHRLRGVFRHVTFAILDREPGGVGDNVIAFRRVFGVRSSILGVSAHVPETRRLSNTLEEEKNKEEGCLFDTSVLAEAKRLRQHLRGAEASRAGHRSHRPHARTSSGSCPPKPPREHMGLVTPRSGAFRNGVGYESCRPGRMLSESPWQRRFR